MGVCPQHTFWSGLLPGDSREQVQRLIDHPECCGCVRNNHCTGQAERLVCGLDKLVEQASYFSQSIQDSCTLLLNCRDLLPSEVRSSRSLAKSKENSILIFKQQLLSLESGPVLAIMCQLRSYIQYIYCRLILIACSCKIIMGKKFMGLRQRYEEMAQFQNGGSNQCFSVFTAISSPRSKCQRLKVHRAA